MTVWDRVARGLRRSSLAPSTVDLTGSWEATWFLLSEPSAWRVRAVERLTVGSARLCRRRRSLQAAPLNSAFLSAGLTVAAPRAQLLLPVELISKRPLLDFDVSVDGEPAYLVPRAATSDLEAEQVRELARRDGVELSEAASALVTAVCDFTPTTWKHYRRRRPWLRLRTALSAYVREGLGTPLGAKEEERLRAAARRVARQTAAAGDGVYRWWSAADEPLLATIGLAQRIGSARSADLIAGFDELADALEELASNVGECSRATQGLATYGRLWQSFVMAEVPTDRPFIIATERQEPIRLSWSRGRARQSIVMADAGRNHITLGTSDESVELGHVELWGARKEVLGLVTGLRQSRERYAVYLAEPDRPERGAIDFRLRVPGSIAAVSFLIVLVTWLAAVLTLHLLVHQRLSVEDLAVLAVPTTFAASLLLTRERNSLARRLQWKSRLLVWLGTAALWGLAAYAWSQDLLVVS